MSTALRTQSARHRDVDEPAQPAGADRHVAGRDHRHRRRGRRAGVAAVDGRRFPCRTRPLRPRRRRDDPAGRVRRRTLQFVHSRGVQRHRARAGHRARRARPGGFGRALHDRRPADAQHRHVRQRPVPRRRRARGGAAREFPHRRGPHVPAGAERSDRRPRRLRTVRQRRPRPRGAVGLADLAGRRRVRGGRQRLGIGSLGRPRRPARRVPTRQLGADRARPAQVARGTADRQDGARARSPRQRVRAQRAGVLRGPVAHPAGADQVRRHDDCDPDGHRRGVCRAEHDVLGRVVAHARDRHTPCAWLRCGPGRNLRAARSGRARPARRSRREACSCTSA